MIDDIHLRVILTLFLLCEVQGKGESRQQKPASLARLDALRRTRGSEEQLGQLIQEELDRTPAEERDKLLGYFERWLDRQLETLLVQPVAHGFREFRLSIGPHATL
jgi:hypothetical protein